MIPFLLVLIESDKIFYKALNFYLNFNFSEYDKQMKVYRLYLQACGYSENEFDRKLLQWIDDQWHSPTYSSDERYRFSYWN